MRYYRTKTILTSIAIAFLVSSDVLRFDRKIAEHLQRQGARGYLGVDFIKSLKMWVSSLR